MIGPQEFQNKRNSGFRPLRFQEVSLSCPYFKQGYFGVCVAPDAIHVPDIGEMQSFCCRPYYSGCPSFSDSEQGVDTGEVPLPEDSDRQRESPKTHLDLKS